MASCDVQVCHGLRNPLHALLGLLDESETVQRDGGWHGTGAPSPPRGLDTRAMKAELRTMQSVLNAVVDTQQLEAGSATVTMGPTDLQAVVRDVCQYHRSLLDEKVELDVSLAPDVPEITSDGDRIGQVRCMSSVRVSGATRCCAAAR